MSHSGYLKDTVHYIETLHPYLNQSIYFIANSSNFLAKVLQNSHQSMGTCPLRNENWNYVIKTYISDLGKS